MKLSEHLQPERISTDLSSSNKLEALTELGVLLAKPGNGPDTTEITKALLERERLATTGVGEGVAIPHAKLSGLEENRIAIGISRTGVDFDAIDGARVKIFFALIAPLSSSGDHLKILAQISRLLKDPEIRQRLIDVSDAATFISLIRVEEGKQ
jgi:nitrogen PTS system EIIA component